MYRQGERSAAVSASSSMCAAWVSATTAVRASSPSLSKEASGQSATAAAAPKRSSVANTERGSTTVTVVADVPRELGEHLADVRRAGDDDAQRRHQRLHEELRRPASRSDPIDRGRQMLGDVGRQLGLRIVETRWPSAIARRHHDGAARTARFEDVVDDADVGARSAARQAL